MFNKKSLKQFLIISNTLIGGIFLIPASALATSCPAIISGTTFSGLVCDFDINNSVTVANGGEVGGINQDNYTPLSSSFITNNGTIISSDTVIGININNSSLSNGIINNGTISADDSAIAINNTSTVSGGVSNTGILTSQINFTFQLDNDSMINGDINNSGSIISNSSNNPALLIRNNSLVNGNINNSGAIRGGEIGDGLLIFESTINGNVTNSGTINGGGSGFNFRNVGIITGDIINSGSITGDDNDGINITQAMEINGNINNSGTISGGNNGISVDSFSTIHGSIINQAGANILGGSVGIFVNDGSTINGGIASHGTITGGVNSIFIGADSTVSSIDTFDGSVINGAIDAVNTDVNINGGDINGTMNVNSVNINSGAVFTMDHTITVQNAVTNAGDIVIGSTTQTITGNYTQSTGGTLKINAQNTATYGQLAATGAVDLSQSGAIDVNILSNTNITIGNTLSNVISGNTLTIPTGGFDITDNSRLLSFSAALNNSNNGINLTAINDPNTSVFQSNVSMGNKGGLAAAAKLDEIIAANPSGDWQNVISSLNGFNSDQEIANAVKQTVPALTGATNIAIIENMNTALRIIQDRQEPNQQSKSSISSGDDLQTNRNLWIKTFGSFANQSDKSGVVGYNSDAYGIITGADKKITDQSRLGIAASYFNSKLNSNDDNNKVNVDSFLGIVYGNYSLDDKTEANAQIAAGYNRNHSNRYINFGDLNRTATANYDGWNLHAGSGISHLLSLNDDTTITPQLRLDYFSVANQSYSESGAGALDLNVASQTQSQLIPALEAKATHNFTHNFSLTLNTGLGYDLLHDANKVSASFASGGDFTTSGLKPSPWILRSGAGITWKQNQDLDLTANYDRKDRGNYDNQTVSVKMRMMF
ncbi:MAG: autotransporter domain-containing protein [Pseudomonadota bacterium]